jgi:phosphoglucosamine mutase
MNQDGYSLGGEQSGHIIIKKYATTGDGILTAIMVAEEMLDRKESLSKIVSPVKAFPQKLKSVYVTNKNAVMEDIEVLKKYNEINSEIGSDGRISLRKSGTEPMIRIMVEHQNITKCDGYIEKMINLLKKRGYIINE